MTFAAVGAAGFSTLGSNLLALASSAFFAGGAVAMSRGLKAGDTGVGVLVTLYVNAVVYTAVTVGMYASGSGTGLPVLGIAAFALAGILGPYLARAAFFASIHVLGSGRASSLEATEAGFTALLAWLLLSEALTLMPVVGILTIAGGVAVLAFESSVSSRSGRGRLAVRPDKCDSGIARSSRARTIWIGFAAGLASAFLYACANVLRKTGLGYIPSAAMGATIGVYAAAICHTCYFAMKRPLSTLLRLDKSSLWSYVVAGLCLAGGWWTFLVALSGSGTGVATALKNASPLWAMVMGRFILGRRERIGHATVAGAAMIVAGVALIVIGG